MINELLSKYKDQKAKTFGENHIEKCYPVSAVIAMLEEQAKQLRQPPVIKSVCDCERCEDIYMVEVYKCGKCNLKVRT